MKKKIYLSIFTLIIYLILCIPFSTITANATSTYTVVLSPVGGNYDAFSITYTGTPISIASNGNILEFSSGTPVTITITAKSGYILFPEQDCRHGGDAIVTTDRDYEECNKLWDSVSNGNSYDEISGLFTDNWKTYIITINNSYDLSTMNFIFETLPEDLTENNNINIENSTEEEIVSPPQNQPDSSESDESESLAGRDKVAQYEADDTSDSHWNQVVVKIKEFEKPIEIVTNFMFGIGTLTAILCLIISIFSFSTSGTHPKERRKSIENMTASLICIAMLGSIKLISILLLQIVL